MQARSGELAFGESLLNYLTLDIAGTGHSQINLWNDESSTGRTVVTVHADPTFQLTSQNPREGGTLLRLETSTTVRAAAIRQAESLLRLRAADPTSSGIISPPVCNMATVGSTEQYENWEKDLVRNLMNSTKAIHFTGDIYSENLELLRSSRQWTTVIVISNPEQAATSALLPEALAIIIEHAQAIDLDSHTIPFQQDGDHYIAKRSWYLGTDGGTRLVEDPMDPSAPESPQDSMSSRPAVHLWAYLLPTELEYQEGNLGPPIDI